MSRTSTIVAAVIAPLALGLLAGCPMGPETIRVNRTIYNESMQSTNEEQLLLNIVRLKYHGSTCFMEINAIQSAFRFDLNGSLQFQNPRYINRKSYGLSNSGGWVGNVAGDYSETPTITYSPLQGELFARRVLQPMDFPTLQLLLTNGWKMGDLLQAGFESVGDMHNRPESEKYLQFLKLCDLLQDIHRRNALDVRLSASKEGKEGILMDHVPMSGLTPELVAFAEKNSHRIVWNEDRKTFNIVQPASESEALVVEANCQSAEEAAELRSLLWPAGTGKGGQPAKGGDERKVSVCLSKNPTPAQQATTGPDVITLPIRVRSLNNVLLYFGEGVEIPPGDLPAAQAFHKFPSPEVEEAWQTRARNLLNIKCGAVLPPNASVAVFYHGCWFYIADDDCKSKDTFAMLGHIYAIQAGEVKSNAPVLALPVGGG